VREIIDHVVSGDRADQLRIFAVDEPGAGGACHLYRVEGLNSGTNASDPYTKLYGFSADHTTILFQNGPLAEQGVNGVTHEALLAVVIDRLRSFQNGPFACPENESALFNCQMALMWLQERTKARLARGVEGTSVA
jgi:hypothetical protein